MALKKIAYWTQEYLSRPQFQEETCCPRNDTTDPTRHLKSQPKYFPNLQKHTEEAAPLNRSTGHHLIWSKHSQRFQPKALFSISEIFQKNGTAKITCSSHPAPFFIIPCILSHANQYLYAFLKFLPQFSWILEPGIVYKCFPRFFQVFHSMRSN